MIRRSATSEERSGKETRSDHSRNQALWLLIPAWALVVGVSIYATSRLPDSVEIVDHYGWTVLEGAMIVIGVLILANRPRNLVGRLILAAGICFAFGEVLFVVSYWLAERGSLSPAGLVEAMAFSLNTLGIPLLIAALVYFPDGSVRWRWVPPVLWLAAGLAFLAPLTNGGWGGDPAEGVRSNPLQDVLSPLGEVLATGFGISLLVVSLTACVTLIVRFRHSEGVARQQMKWLAFAAFLLILWIPIETLSGTIAWLVPVAAVGPVLLTLALTAIALAVLRYRLYEIDRIISRTVSYALVIALLLGIFFGTVTLLTSLLPTDSSLAVAASTLAVFALFNPARKRIQDRVDRRFNRSRYQSNQVLDRFAVDLRDQTDFDQLTAGLTSVVLETLHPVGLGIWISDGADAT